MEIKDAAKIILNHKDEELDFKNIKSEITGKFQGALAIKGDKKSIFETQPVFKTPEEADACIKDMVKMVRKLGKSVFTDQSK